MSSGDTISPALHSAWTSDALSYGRNTSTLPVKEGLHRCSSHCSTCYSWEQWTNVNHLLSSSSSREQPRSYPLKQHVSRLASISLMC